MHVRKRWHFNTLELDLGTDLPLGRLTAGQDRDKPNVVGRYAYSFRGNALTNLATMPGYVHNSLALL